MPVSSLDIWGLRFRGPCGGVFFLARFCFLFSVFEKSWIFDFDIFSEQRDSTFQPLFPILCRNQSMGRTSGAELSVKS